MRLVAILVWVVASVLGIWMILSTNIVWINLWGPWGGVFCFIFYPVAFIGSPIIRLAQGATPLYFLDYAAMVLFLVCVRVGSNLNVRLAQGRDTHFRDWQKDLENYKGG
jgi:hypothetical protein